jgi:aspartate/methionine/tyrosine aminotransferase
VVSQGSVRKTYGLPGLRLCWLASRQTSIIKRRIDFEYSTMMGDNAPSEFVTALAMRYHQVFINRKLQTVKRNLEFLDAFMKQRSSLFGWVSPNPFKSILVMYTTHNRSLLD